MSVIEITTADAETLEGIRAALGAPDAARAVRFPDDESSPPNSVIPDVASRANKALVFDGVGAVDVLDLNPPPPTLLAYLQSLSPWALWDSSSVVAPGNNISQLLDLSGNARHLTDSQTNTAQLQLSGPDMLASATRGFIGMLPSGVFPTKFQAFLIFKITTVTTTAQLRIIGPAAAANGNACLQCAAGSGGAVTGFGGFGASANTNVCSPPLASGTYVLAEILFDGSAPAQLTYINGALPSAVTTVPASDFTWSGIKFNVNPTTGSSTKSGDMGYRNLAVFDAASGFMPREQVEDIFNAYRREYPDINILPRYI